MSSIQLIFKKIGNHWYLDIDHDNPQDLKLDPVLERYLNIHDTWNRGIVDNIYLVEQCDFLDSKNILQFSDNDLLRYFTNKDPFKMHIFINNHSFKISSNLYTIFENTYHADFHILVYKFEVY